MLPRIASVQTPLSDCLFSPTAATLPHVHSIEYTLEIDPMFIILQRLLVFPHICDISSAFTLMVMGMSDTLFQRDCWLNEQINEWNCYLWFYSAAL